MDKYDITRFASFSAHRGPVRPTLGRRKFLIAGASLAAAAALPVLPLAPGAEALRSRDGLLRTRLRVRYARNRIGGVQWVTRTFDGRIPGPTLRMRPGDTLQLRLFNDLPPEAEEHHPMDINMPHGFNVTNLHTHGLHVSPKCSDDGTVCSDNVLIEIEPGESQLFEYTLPQNHPDGTYWYHPHKHGSAAIQVMGGMAGALIIEGDTDDFLRAHGVTRDQVFVLQGIKVLEDEAGFIDESSFLSHPMFTVNGKLQPTVRVRPGEVQRWRFINACEHEHMPLVLRADEGHAPQTFHQLAVDGITLPALEEAQHIFLASGNRLDVLVKIDEPGVYRLIKPELSQGTSEEGGPLLIPEEFLATVIVAPGKPDDTPLPRGPLPRPSSALPPIQDHEINGTRLVTFAVDFSTSPPQFLVDGKLFDPNRVDQVIQLGAVEEWTVINTSPEDHPFHIHQNAFLVTEINGDPGGQPTAELPLWMDTVNVPRIDISGRPGSVTFRSRFEDFDGQFVLHCHLIHHEDMGMMQLVEIVG
jgi:FtsP/CotA-like multicopper oxidase with cupredoxin domain